MSFHFLFMSCHFEIFLMMSSLVFSFSVMKMQGEVKAAACLSLVGLSASGLVLVLWWLFVVLNVLSGGLTCLSLLGLSASLVQIHVPNRKILTKTWGFY